MSDEKPTWPEYLRNDLTADAQAHLLGAITCLYAAHDELQRGRVASAHIEVDKARIVAGEARKIILGMHAQPPTPIPPPAGPDQPTLL